VAQATTERVMLGIPAHCATLLACLLAAQLLGSAPARAISSPSDCRAWLYGFTVSCTVEPDVDVAIVARDGAGFAHAAGSARSDRTSGAVTVPLRSIASTAAAILRPSDVLEISIAGAVVALLELPAYRSEVTDDGRLLVGITSPGAAMSFARGRPGSGSSPDDVVAVGDDGAFGYALDPPLGPGDIGFVRISTDDQLTASAYIVPTALELSILPPRLSGFASPGTAIDVEGHAAGAPFARRFEVPHDGSGAPGAFGLALPTLDEGTPFTLTARMPEAVGRTVSIAAVPDLWVALDRSQRAVYGGGPPQQALRVTAGPLDRGPDDARLVDEIIQTASDGTFRLDVSTEASAIDPGWHARAAYTPEPGLEVAATQVLAYLRAEVHGSTIDGVVETDSPVTVTLQTPGGALKARQLARSDELGAFRARLLGHGLTSAAAVRPGDRVVVDVGSHADPIVLSVPPIAVRTDAASGLLRGDAEPGTRLVVMDAGLTRQVAEGQVGVDGTFAVPVAGIVPGASGVVRVHSTAGHQLDVRWAALGLELDLRRPVAELAGNGLPGRRVDVRVTTSEGEPMVALGAELSSGVAAPEWRLPLRDVASQTARLVPGDRIEVRMGDERRSFVVPVFDVVPNSASNTIAGATLPNIPVTLGVQRAPLSTRPRLSEPIELTSDDRGQFAVALPESFALGHNDAVLALALPYEGVTLQRTAAVHGLTVDLTAAQLRVAAEPGAYRVEVVRGGSTLPLQASIVTADAQGRAEASLVDRDGKPVALTAGDAVRVERVGVPGAHLAATIPEIRLDVDWLQRRVRGAAPTAHETWLVASPSTFRGVDIARSQGELRPERDARGGFEASFDAFVMGAGGTVGIDARPGLLLELRSEALDGTRFLLSERAPLVNTAVGGAWVCLLGRPHDDVALALLDAQGMQRAHASGAVDARGRWSAGWTAAAGELVVTRTGDRVVGAAGAQAISMTLPRLDVLPDWHAGIPAGRALESSRVTGSTSPRAEYFVAQDDQARDPCFAGLDPPRYATRGRADADGAFSTELERVAVGGAVEVAQYDAAGHRAFRRVRRLKARVELGTRGVELAGSPAITTVLTWSRTGETLAQVATTLDGFGRAQIELVSSRDPAAVLRAGDRLSFTSAQGDEAADLVLLDVDSLGDGSLVGIAPPGATVWIDVTLGDGRAARLSSTADEDGRFALGPNDLPARRDWQLGDATAYDVVLEISDGHEQLVRILNLAPAPDDRHSVWLPFLVVPSHRR